MMFTAIRLLPILAIGSLLTSCQNGQNPFSQQSGSTDPYVSNYGNDGGYNPYPGSSGSTTGGYTSPPTYTPPPAPVEADPYAFNAPTSAPKTSSTPKKTASSSKSKSSTAKKSTAKKSSGSYKVAKGDTLYGIAKKRGTTVAKIKAANGMSSDLIRPGQSLKIP
ncbi:LysM peptidoglycan-binding domain-containing protein [Prosthecobacter dejongeii]|uniref:LysM repeat protein n=1 Tax=Prosthecobacter dejongeii TaxID=48465 RepID=A0A7W7YJS9_9BACT|nr:LysM peptidoglycan-binding domain-containing protein [Prosthecobacter dejongeii]MBB5037525.1 LysM repeat protein [Prosthecobacter dejongeii]